MELQIKLCPKTTCPGYIFSNLHDTQFIGDHQFIFRTQSLKIATNHMTY